LLVCVCVRTCLCEYVYEIACVTTPELLMVRACLGTLNFLFVFRFVCEVKMGTPELSFVYVRLPES
jgi:hypothetical protein